MARSISGTDNIPAAGSLNGTCAVTPDDGRARNMNAGERDRESRKRRSAAVTMILPRSHSLSVRSVERNERGRMRTMRGWDSRGLPEVVRYTIKNVLHCRTL